MLTHSRLGEDLQGFITARLTLVVPETPSKSSYLRRLYTTRSKESSHSVILVFEVKLFSSNSSKNVE